MLFRASLSSVCPVCQEPIEPGELIGEIDNELLCEDCWRESVDW